MTRAWHYLTFVCAGILWFALFPVAMASRWVCDALTAVVDDSGKKLGLDEDDAAV